MEEKLRALGLYIGFMVAGFMGALISVSKGNGNSIRKSIFAIVCGIASANYLTGIVITIMEIPKGIQYGIAFILGFLGLRGVEIIANKFVKNAKQKDITGSIKNNTNNDTD